MDSDSDDLDSLLEFDEFLENLATEADQEHENDTESETESEIESETEGNVNCPINHMMPFYQRRKDIFDMFDDEQVVRTFRFDKQTILYITGLVEDSLPQRHTKCERRLLPVDQVLLALQFFATGTFQSVVGNVLRVSQRSVGRSIHAVARALCRLGPKIMTIDKTNLVPVSYIVTYTLVHTNTSLNCSYKKILLKLPTCQECLDALTEPTSGSHVHMSGKLLMSIARDITQLTFKYLFY